MVKCIVCGGFAPVAPFCLNCMLDMDDDEYRVRVAVWKVKDALEDKPVKLAWCRLCGHLKNDDGDICDKCRRMWEI